MPIDEIVKFKGGHVNRRKFYSERRTQKRKKHEKCLSERKSHPGKCTNCGGDPELKMDSTHVFKQNLGPIWECKCGARVRCHENTTLPL